MKTRKMYTLTRRISRMMLLLFGATVVLSGVLMGFFYRTSYRETVSSYRKYASDDAAAVSRLLQTAGDQMSWISSEAKKASPGTDTDPYERSVRCSSVTDSITDALRISDVMDAIVIIPRNSHMILEAHTMTEDRFLRFLDQCTDTRAYLRPSLDLMRDPRTEAVTHIVFHVRVKELDINPIATLTTASVFATVPVDRLMDQMSSGNCQILCYERDKLLIPVAARGVDVPLPETLPMDLADGDALTLAGERYTVISAPVAGISGRLLLLVKQGEIIGHMYAVLGILLAAVCVLLLLTVLGIRSTSRWMHAPINRLVKDIRHVSEGPGPARLRDSMATEITEISRSVNLMLDELDHRNEQLLQTQANVRELELLHKDSQLRALQSQIDPHFLYNTLECVRSIAFAYRVEEISDILDSIIQIYRYSASDATGGTVRSEFDCCASYANVIGYRFGSKYTIEMSVEPGVEDTPIPRMVMQPLLENAINHGYAKTDRGGTVRITAARSGDGSVLIRMRDQGCGIAAGKLTDLREQIGDMENRDRPGSIGLRNVHHRLRRTFGEGFGLELESEEGVFTEVTLRIPEKEGGTQA